MDSTTQNGLVEFCRELIRTPSLAGKETRIAAVIRSKLQELGFDNVITDKFGSVIGMLENGEGPTVVFDAHIDTVGVEPLNDWQYQPFGGWVDNGRIYGRGTVDEKGPAAAMVYGLAELAKDRSFNGTIIASLSALEEVSEGVALANTLDKYRADTLVICEPSNLKLVRGQRGRAEIQITTHGTPSHSSTPHLGNCAVEMMSPVINKMHNMALPTHPLLGKGVQALTDIISTPYPATSMIPHQCTATFDRRLMVGETEESVLSSINSMLADLEKSESEFYATSRIAEAKYTAYTGMEYEFRKFLQAWEFPAESVHIAKGFEALRSVVANAELGCYQFCTNGSLPERHMGIPTLGFGPGDEALAHRIDEYIEIEELALGAKGFAAIARKLTE